MSESKDLILLSSGRYVKIPKAKVNAEEKDEKETRPMLERVNNVWGSTAGAGSDFFHIYRKHRAHEMERLRKLDEDYEREKEEEDFQQRRLELLKQNSTKSHGKAAKRKLQKKKRKGFKTVTKPISLPNAMGN